MGKGSFGSVVKVRHRDSQKLYAIKLIDNISKNAYEAKKVLREILILK